MRGVRQGTRLNGALTAAKLVPLVLLILFGLAAIDPANLRWPAAPAASDVSRASIFLIFVVGVAIELLLFAPLERRVLRRRGLTGTREG